ncbi:hypothetical protein KC717_04615, partial [Candidatus Dojkabacteria bacterium]|nr:hypothetical protein [Candidatus Dojkabacteria bacterium]
MIEELGGQRNLAQRAAIATKFLLVKPTRVIQETGYFLPDHKEVGPSLMALDRAIESGDVLFVEPGIRTKIVHWNGVDAVICSFDENGKQVGFGVA